MLSSNSKGSPIRSLSLVYSNSLRFHLFGINSRISVVKSQNGRVTFIDPWKIFGDHTSVVGSG